MLKEIREEACVHVLSVHHTVGFAVPAYRNREAIAGLSVFIPESRYTEAHRERLFRLLRRTAKRISERLKN